MQTVRVINGDTEVVDVLGVTVEFLAQPAGTDPASFCVMKGTFPAAMSVPLHADAESFFVLSGTAQVLTERKGRSEWMDVTAGDFVHIPGNTKHAHRNFSREPVMELVITTARLGRFFQEVGRPATRGTTLALPTAADIERFQRIAAKYGHWLASPAENADVGIS